MRVITTTFLTLFYVLAMAKPQQVKVMVQNTVSGLQDETTVFFDSTGAPNFSMFEDLSKTFNPSQAVPQVYSLSADSVACLSNAYGLFTGPVSISLGVRLDSGGVYKLSASDIDNFDPITIVLLEDRQTGSFYNLRSATYTFYNSQAQFIIGRFVLHISAPPVVTVTDADCNDMGGTISLYQEPTIKWTSVVAYDSVGTIMGTYSNVNGNFSFTMLPEGSYTLAFIYGDYIANKTVFVPGHKIEVSISASTYLSAIGQTIQFYSTTVNATMFNWDFGDNTIITGIANPEVTYYQSGFYQVVLACGNAHGCSASDTLIIKVGPATGINEAGAAAVKVFGTHKNIVLENLSVSSPTTWVVSNLLGARVADGKTESSNETIRLNGQPDGVYIITLNGPQGRLSRKVILKD